MGGPFLLAIKYVLYHRVKTAILVIALTFTMFSPLVLHVLIGRYEVSLTARADATPLVVGMKGDRFDLVLKALYYRDLDLSPIMIAQVDEVRESELATAIPLHLRYSARGYPIVGTTLDYLAFRGLSVETGRRHAVLGQATVGANVARELNISPGDALFSDQKSLYDITKTYPLKMHITGILSPTGTPEDDAVFVDVKTAWIIDGIAHGHVNVFEEEDDSIILERDDKTITTNASIFEYNEVTADNIGSFHVHSSRDQLPVSAIVVLPNDRKSATLLKARYNASKTFQMLEPREVIDELLDVVFRVKRVFDAGTAFVAVSTAMFVVLVVLLSFRLRKREMETIVKLGGRWQTVVLLYVYELWIVILLSALAAFMIAAGCVLAAPSLTRLA